MSRSDRTRPASAPPTSPSSWATPPACARPRAGSRASRSRAPCATCSRTGGRGRPRPCRAAGEGPAHGRDGLPGQGSRARADLLAREAAAAGRDVVLLYPGVVYGPGDRTEGNIVVNMVADHLRGAFPGIIGPGDRLWSYAFVEDVAGGHVAALERGRAGERY